MEPENNLQEERYKEIGSFVGGVEARDTRIVANCSAPPINWLFQLSAERNSVHLWWRLFLCATNKEGFSTGKRCFLVSFTDGVGEKERNSTKISQLNLQGLF